MHQLRKLLIANRHNSGRRFEVLQAADTSAADIYLYDAIVNDEMEAEYFGGVAAGSFVRALNAISAPVINLRINSPGGSVFAARAMEQALREHPSKVVAHIDGLAASAASFLMMAADEIVMAPGALVMIHKGWTLSMGNADDMRSSADLLDKIDGTLVATYAARSKQTPETILQWMADETWFTAQEAIDNGLADSIAEGKKVAAKWDTSAYGNAPPSARDDDTAALLRRLSIAERTTA